jgi:hypothetical protein
LTMGVRQSGANIDPGKTLVWSNSSRIAWLTSRP